MLFKGIFERKQLSTSKSGNKKSAKQGSIKLPSSASIRIAVIFAFLTGLLVIVAGTGAQNLLKIDLSNKLLKTKSTERTARRIPNFDIRLSGKENLDRLFQSRSLQDADSLIAQTAISNRTNIENGVAKLQAAQSDAVVEGSEFTGAVEIVRSRDGLTKAAPGRSGEDIVREFISENRGIYGLDSGDIANLNFIGESISPESGLRMVRVEQIVNGRPIFQSETRFILDRDGRLIRSLGLMIPSAPTSAEALGNLLSPQEALKRTMAQFNIPLEVETMNVVKSEEEGMRTEMRVKNPNIGSIVTSKLVYFAAAPGVLIPAWSQTVFGVNEDWYVLVDARDGTQLWRKNIRSHVSTHDARFRVFVQADGTTPADSPAPQSPSSAVPGGGTQFPGIAPTIVTMFTAQSATASPNGWIDDCPGGVCTAAQTQTLGNNALACMDRDAGAGNVCDTVAASVLDGNGRPTGNPDVNARNRDFLGTAPRDFQTNYLPPPQGGNPEAGQTSTGAGNNGTLAVDQFRRASVTQQFYVTNWYHDKLFALGFNEAAGNFQQLNFSGFGLGGDRVNVDVQDSTNPGVDNANFSTPADGTSGRAQMFVFTGPTIDRDGGIDSEILMHELTHGTSNRIIGNGSGLVWDIGSGMGEGWSDFYALSLLNNTAADNPDGNYASGAYATYKAFGVVSYLDNYVYGIRRFPYSTVNTVNPLTWADADQTTNNLSGGVAPDPLGFNIGGAGEVHNVGEIWFQSLWEVRSRIIAANGGVVPTGNQISLQLVTDAMKLTPANPSFLQARDALIAADCATNACANEQSIWDGFADRGLGYNARVPNQVSFTLVAPHIGVVESFQPANLDVNTVTVSDGIGNNSGFIDPNEPVRIVANIKNPWLGATKTATGVTATITSTTPGVTILSGSTNYPNIAPNSNANKLAAANNLVIKAPPTSPCGTNLSFTLTITSSLGTAARNFTFRMGAPSGTQAPVTYTNSALALTIQDNRPIGVGNTINVPDDYDIADIDVRIDTITHTFPGDMTFSVKGPNGYGTDLLSFLGGNVAGGGNGDNITNMRFDDDAPTFEVLNATNAQAPYTGSWRPVFNSPVWAAIGFPPAEATPQLSRFDNSSSLGAWRGIASDQAATDAGVWQGWSLIITPRAFTCTAFVPTAANVGISGMVTDAGGRAIPRVNVLLTDSQGQTRTARTNSFGYYRFDGVASGQTYTLDAQAKGYTFVPQVVSVNDEIADMNLTAQQ